MKKLLEKNLIAQQVVLSMNYSTNLLCMGKKLM